GAEGAAVGGDAGAAGDQGRRGAGRPRARELLGDPRRLVGDDRRSGDDVALVGEQRLDDPATLVTLRRARVGAGDHVDFRERRGARLVLVGHVLVMMMTVIVGVVVCHVTAPRCGSSLARSRSALRTRADRRTVSGT